MLKSAAVQRRATSGSFHWPDDVLVFLFPVAFFSEKGIFFHSSSQSLMFEIWIAVKQHSLWGSRIKRYRHVTMASADTDGPYPALPSSKSMKILACSLAHWSSSLTNRHQVAWGTPCMSTSVSKEWPDSSHLSWMLCRKFIHLLLLPLLPLQLLIFASTQFAVFKMNHVVTTEQSMGSTADVPGRAVKSCFISE